MSSIESSEDCGKVLPVAQIVEPSVTIPESQIIDATSIIIIDVASANINEEYEELIELSKKIRVLVVCELILNLILTIYNYWHVFSAMVCYVGFQGAKKYKTIFILIYYVYAIFNMLHLISVACIYGVNINDINIYDIILYIPLFVIKIITFKYVFNFKKKLTNLTHYDITTLNAIS